MPLIVRSQGAIGPEGPRRRVLVVIQAQLTDHAAGPQIRGLELARAFAARHEVTIAASAPVPASHSGLPVIARNRASLMAALRSHDVVIAPVLPPYLIGAMAARACIRVADLYDPVELEVGTLNQDRSVRRALSRQQNLRDLQLRFADVIVCANARQRERAVRDLERVGRPDGPAMVTVPMGLSEPGVASNGQPLRRRFGIDPSDPLILWWGSVWRWLDAETAIHAVKILSERRPRLRLVITSGRPADRRTHPLNATEDAREVARRLGVLDRNVFFLDTWVPYEERQHYLGDADLGLTLHAGGPESSLAARARYMDYIWASLPSVLAEGDELAGQMAASGAAWLVPPRDPYAAAAMIDRIFDEPWRVARARDACRMLARDYRWPQIIEPLMEVIEATEPKRYPAPRKLLAACQSGSFYAMRAVGLC